MSRRSFRRSVWVALAAVLVLVPCAANGRHARRGEARRTSVVVLDGVATRVRWIDGDTFRVLEGAHEGTRSRLDGYNTLESYGPVHRWGTWSPGELLENARAATAIARAGRWTCSTRGRQDRYGRILVSCPDAAAELVRTGHALVFAVDEAPDAALVELQRLAQRRRLGMWAKGVPPRIVTSVHSIEEAGAREAYDRVVDSATGEARRVPHARAYRTCEQVCTGEGEARACMLYVPYERRFRHRPPCLRP